jgi:hypothetical protein
MLSGFACSSASFLSLKIILSHPEITALSVTTHVLIVSIGAFENGPMALGKFPDSAYAG